MIVFYRFYDKFDFDELKSQLELILTICSVLF
jgi:hypothetical protein